MSLVPCIQSCIHTGIAIFLGMLLAMHTALPVPASMYVVCSTSGIDAHSVVVTHVNLCTGTTFVLGLTFVLCNIQNCLSCAEAFSHA